MCSLSWQLSWSSQRSHSAASSVDAAPGAPRWETEAGAGPVCPALAALAAVSAAGEAMMIDD